MAGKVDIHDEIKCEVERALGVLDLLIIIGSGGEGKKFRLGDEMVTRTLWALHGALENAERGISEYDMAS